MGSSPYDSDMAITSASHHYDEIMESYQYVHFFWPGSHSIVSREMGSAP